MTLETFANGLRINLVAFGDLFYREHLLVHTDNCLIVNFGNPFPFSGFDALSPEQLENSSFTAVELSAQFET